MTSLAFDAFGSVTKCSVWQKIMWFLLHVSCMSTLQWKNSGLQVHTEFICINSLKHCGAHYCETTCSGKV